MANQTKNKLLKSKLAHSLDVAQVETDTSSDATATDGEIDTNSMELIGNAGEILAIQSTVPAADRIVLTSSLMAAGAGAIPLPGWHRSAPPGQPISNRL